MGYTPILIKEIVQARPRQISKSADMNRLLNTLVAQNNNMTSECERLYASFQDTEDNYNNLVIVLQRQVDNLVAGVMPDGSITEVKLAEDVLEQLARVDEQSQAIIALNNEIIMCYLAYVNELESNDNDIDQILGR